MNEIQPVSISSATDTPNISRLITPYAINK